MIDFPGRWKYNKKMSMKQIKIVKGIPFSTKLPENYVTRADALEAFEEMRRQAADVPEMSLEEINEEIYSARADLKTRKAADYNIPIITKERCDHEY